MIRLLLLLVLLAPSSFAVVVTTTLNYSYGGDPIANKNIQFATNATQNVVTVTVSSNHPVSVEFNNTAAWNYRTAISDSTTDKPIAASQALKLRFTQTTTFYTTRQSADGTMVATVLLQE